MKILLSFCILMSFGLEARVEVTPTALSTDKLEFSDDIQYENMELAIDRQLKNFEARGLKGEIRFGNDVYPKTILKDSIILLKKIFVEARECLKVRAASVCAGIFNQAIGTKFKLYKPVLAETETYYKTGKTRYTSYYSPDFHGSRTPTTKYTRAIYGEPEKADRRHTRVEIDYHGALAGKGLELFYVQESFYDLYLLHVQGGGRINVMNPDGTVAEKKYLSFAGNNKQPFQMVGRYMIEKKYVKNGSIVAQRKFLEENPQKNEEVFGQCPSYIYFKESDEEPVGVQLIPLTEKRSAALDIRIYKTPGLINYVSAVKTIIENGKQKKVPFTRFMIHQDTGGAIRGNARIDLYAGYGPEAEASAYNTNDPGDQYFLIKRD